MDKPLVAIVLAAGEGTRMKSSLPKVLHPICGRPMIQWVLETAARVGPDEIVVVTGHGADQVDLFIGQLDLGVPIKIVHQETRSGTGGAARVALGEIDPADRIVLVLPGDTPLTPAATLKTMVDLHGEEDTAVTLLTTILEDPTGYGRIVRDMGHNVCRIVEQADCSREELDIREVAVSTYVFDEPRLRDALDQLKPDNAQGELYLPDVIEHLFSDVNSVTVQSHEVLGVNDREQLAVVEVRKRAQINGEWMRAGVTLQDPATTYIDADVELGHDVTLLAGTHLAGKTRVSAGATLGPNVRVIDSEIGENTQLSFCVVRDSKIGSDADAGPFASLRAGSDLAAGTHIGSFVEVKKSVIGENSKVPHLSYVGDATIGKDCNLGANTITCNYDGVSKHPTHLGDRVMTGSGSLLVAPVTLGDDTYTGAGAVVNSDVPAGALAVGMPAKNLEGWTYRNRATNSLTGPSNPAD